MTTREQILESVKPLINAPKHVFIDEKNLKKLAKELVTAEVPSWNNNFQFIGTPEETAQYYFFLDSINFCFWAPKGEEKWQYRVGDEWLGGYYGYSRAIKDAFLRDRRYFDAEYLSQIPMEDFFRIFQGRNTLLLLDERLAIIRENFRILHEKFGGQAMDLLRRANNDADTLVSLLISNFPTFRDIEEKGDGKYFFLKRAQIFPSDLTFTGIHELKLSNLDHLTIFSDYKLPQILESAGVLKYSAELDAEIVNEKEIPKGSLKEMELRASSIIASEKIRDELLLLGRNISITELDWILWVKAKSTTFTKPHHKTLTTFY